MIGDLSITKGNKTTTLSGIEIVFYNNVGVLVYFESGSGTQINDVKLIDITENEIVMSGYQCKTKTGNAYDKVELYFKPKAN
jgi:hypothetical protein